MDGTARVRKVGQAEEFGTQAANAPMFARIAQGQLEGSYTSRSVVDGIERLYYYRKLPGYQLVVVDGVETRFLLANHNRAKEALWLQASILSLLIVALVAALARYLQQIRRTAYTRQLAQQQLEERNIQLNAIFELSPDGFVAFDAQKCIKYISPAFTQLTEQGDEPLVGMNESNFSAWLNLRCAMATPFEGIAALRASMANDTTEKRVVIELNLRSKRVLQVGLRSSQSKLVSQILYLRDITHETEVDHMKSEFLATAAHELRTPMASILGFSELMLHEDFDALTQREFLTTIHAQSKLMADILNELLDLARIEARRAKDFRYTRVDLKELLAEICNSYGRPPGRTAPELDLPAQTLYLMADARKLRQALLNIISNAYKYSPDGGSVHITAWVNAGEGKNAALCIEITDHGIGLTQAQIARVCERFYRADTSGKILGTGLGMSIVKEIIDLHHGQLSFNSTPGLGTQVCVCLPTYTTLQKNNPADAKPGDSPDTRPAEFI
jgi:signal transduction histidine kinase